MNNGKNKWAMPKFNKWFWVMLGALAVFFVIMAIKWVG